MVACVACGTPGSSPVCRSCALTLQKGPTFRTTSGVLVTAGFHHSGAARRLVHHLKYQALLPAADALAAGMAQVLPADVSALVPVPRAVARRWRHGIDPADVLARAVSARTGIPVVRALRPAMWWSRHAGRGGAARSHARFVRRSPPLATWVLVDDVATSGATLDAAVAALGSGPLHAVVATAPSRVRNMQGSADGPRDAGGGVAGWDRRDSFGVLDQRRTPGRPAGSRREPTPQNRFPSLNDAW